MSINKEMRIKYSKSIDTINMSKDQFINLFLIDIVIDGDSIPLLFDTGGSKSVISKSLAGSMGLSVLSDSIKAGGNTGKIQSFSTGVIPIFEIGNSFISNLNVIITPDNQLDFGFDEEGNSLKINGVLGWDVISSFKWVIDPHTRTYSIEKPKANKSKELLYWDNMPIINVKYDNRQMYFGFDSGNTESMFSKDFIPLMKNKIEKIDKIAGINEMIEEEVYLVKSIKINISNKDIVLNNISVLKRDIFPAKEFKVMGLLAADIIQNHKCVIDFTNNEFQLI